MDRQPIEQPTSFLQREPAVVVSTLVSFLTAGVGFGVAFGLDIDDDQQQAIIAVVAPAVAVIFMVGPVLRQFVWSPASVKEVRAASVKAGATDSAAPIVP